MIIINKKGVSRRSNNNIFVLEWVELKQKTERLADMMQKI